MLTNNSMGDLFAFDGYLNETAPFTLREHTVSWKGSRRYHDFNIGNTYNETCQYPRFWLETGEQVGKDVTDRMKGCYNSDFDQARLPPRVGIFWADVLYSMAILKLLVSSLTGNVSWPSSPRCKID